MHTRLQRLLYLASLGCAAMATVAASADEIAWQADRPLSWNDFAGPVPGSAEPHRIAVTAASLRFRYVYEIELARASCLYRITEISTTTLFHTDRSWVRPNHRTAAVLAHEQGHFDITQVYRQLFDSAVRPEIGVERGCSGRGGRQTARFVEDDVGSRLNPLYQRFWTSHLALQDVYDEETANGTRPQAQQQWLQRIASGLRSPEHSGFPTDRRGYPVSQ